MTSHSSASASPEGRSPRASERSPPSPSASLCLRSHSSSSLRLIDSCSSNDGKSTLNFRPGLCGGPLRTAEGALLPSTLPPSIFLTGLGFSSSFSLGLSPSSFELRQPPPPVGTRAMVGSLPAFSLRRLGREAGAGTRRLLAETLPSDCMPWLFPVRGRMPNMSQWNVLYA